MTEFTNRDVFVNQNFGSSGETPFHRLRRIFMWLDENKYEYEFIDRAGLYNKILVFSDPDTAFHFKMVWL